MRNNTATMLIALREVFSKTSYLVLAIAVFVAVLVVAVWLPNISFLSHTATTESFTLPQKIGIISSTFGGIQTNFSPLSRTLTVLVALFFAVNVSFFVFYILRAAELSREAGIGTSGFLLGLIGIGCASCGSVILSGIFGVGATAGFIGILPLKGQEFGVLSLILLGVSIYLLAGKIINPLVCKAKPTTFKSLFKRLPSWSKVIAFITLAFFIGIWFANWSVNSGGVTEEVLAAKFEQLSKTGNSTCSGVFKDSILGMPDDARLQGSCCSPMAFHRYHEQVEGLKKYKNIKEIPPDPYDLDAKMAKRFLKYYDLELTPEEQAKYDYASENSDEKGPCCCKCWRWYVYGGLAKFLIREKGFTGEQITEVWNLSDGCGGEGDHVQH